MRALFNQLFCSLRSGVENGIGNYKEEFRGWKQGFGLKTHAECAVAYRAAAVVHNMRANWDNESKSFLDPFHDRFPCGGEQMAVPEGFFDTRVLTPNLERNTSLVLLEHCSQFGYFQPREWSGFFVAHCLFIWTIVFPKLCYTRQKN